MPINTDLNVAPYFDDFDENKNYHRILFRPTTAVQARELTQLQTILQNQIEKFGNWAFKNGDIVDGCTVTEVPSLPYVRIQDFQTNSATFDIENLVNTEVVSASSNLTARVLYTKNGLTSTYPNTNVIYVNYINTGDGGERTFSNNETLNFFRIPRTDNLTASSSNDTVAIINTIANTVVDTNASGNAYGIWVSEGTVYLNGTFVKVVEPHFGIVNAYGTYAANLVSGFMLSERIVSENQDDSLLDNALGYPNENAPGAHRLELTPSLITLTPEDAANTDGFNPIAVFNYGSLVSKQMAGSNLYSIVESAISQRVYDQAGNYVVNPFSVDFVTEPQSNNNVSANNAFVINSNNVLARINPGVGYAQGSRVSLDTTYYMEMRRGVDTKLEEDKQITFNYGNYFLLNEVAGSFAFDKAQEVQLYDLPQQAISTRRFAGLNPSGNNIGTALMRCFSYVSGDQGTNTAQYALHIFNINLKPGYDIKKTKSVYYNGATKGVADVISTGVVDSDTKQQLFTFGSYGTKEIPAVDTNYVYRAKVSTTMNTSGVITVTVPNSGETLPYGIGPLPELEAATINLIVTANTDSNILGTATCYSTNNLVTTGSANSFAVNFGEGDQIKIGTDIRTVTQVINSTALTVDAAFSNSTTGNYYKTYVAGKILPISLSDVSGSSVVVSNSTVFVINSGQIPSTSLNVDVVFDVLKTNATPARKIINKNRFVKINVSTVANVVSLSGNVNVSNTTTLVVGTGTSFTNNFSVGDIIRVGAVDRTITAITNSTYLNVNTAWTVSNTAAAYSKVYTTSKNGPWCLGVADVHKLVKVYGSANNSYTTNGVDLTRNFVIDTGQRDTHYGLAYLYAKPGYSPETYPNLLVQLDYFTVNTTPGTGFFTIGSYPINDSTPVGTVNVSSSSTTVVGNNTLFTTSFTVGDYIIVAGTSRKVSSISNNTQLLVDANWPNTLTLQNYGIRNESAIKTKDIPLYVTDSGRRIPLRDYIDFRVPCNNSANNTGPVDIANTSQVTTAISYATINPSSTLNLNVPAAGLNVPSYGRNFDASYTVYLPRQDLIYITPDNLLKIKEGVSSSSPQAPLYPENCMVLSVVNIPPYPSLSSDQIDEFLSINQSATSLIRDTKQYISSRLVTNRRYTMRDVGLLEARITNLEYYTQLSLLEKKAADMTVTDEFGLDRFKNGIFVEPFSNFSLADVSNPEYSMAIDQKRGVGRPSIVREVVPIAYNQAGSVNSTKTGRVVSLPYTEKEFIVQPYATKYRSAALVAYSWNGSVRLIPAFDNHNDTINTGSINVSVDATKPWIEFANSPFGQTWGDWTTKTNVTSTSVVWGTSTQLNLGYIGRFNSQQQAEAAALSIIHQRYGRNVTVGALVIQYA